MKAKRLAKILLEDPDIEVIIGNKDVGSVGVLYTILKDGKYEADPSWGKDELQEGEKRIKAIKLMPKIP